MTDKEIESRVNLIVSHFLKDKKVKPEEVPVIQAGIDLFVNFIWCMNVMANKRSN